MAPPLSRSARSHRRTRGLSTAEVLAGMALSLLISATIVTFQQAQMKAMAVQNDYAQSQMVTRTVIDLMTRELRMASYDPIGTALPASDNPAWCQNTSQGLVTATATRLRFQQDLDGDGLIDADSAGEDVTYELGAGGIWRTDGNTPPVLLVGNVPAGGLVFRYFDRSNPPIEYFPSPALTQGQRDCVWKVRLSVTGDVLTANGVRSMRSRAETEVAIRSRSLMNF